MDERAEFKRGQDISLLISRNMNRVWVWGNNKYYRYHKMKDRIKGWMVVTFHYRSHEIKHERGLSGVGFH